MGHDAPVLFLMILGAAFLGSWHCAGMCGPIVAALSARQKIWLYHFGRGVSYTLAGGLAGWVGQQGLQLPPLAFRITAGVFLALAILYTLGFSLKLKWFRTWTQKSFRLIRWGRGWLFTTGFLSIFLPCGWLWSYLFAAAATGSPLAGALVLLALWLGSLPALALVGGYIRKTLPLVPGQAQRWATLVVIGAGFYSLLSHFFFS